jgi:hypothetical protein
VIDEFEAARAKYSSIVALFTIRVIQSVTISFQDVFDMRASDWLFLLQFTRDSSFKVFANASTPDMKWRTNCEHIESK